MTTMMLAAMDATIVSTVVPQIVADLGGFSLFTWVFSIYVLAQAVTIPIYGKLADQYGRKPILLVGTVAFLAGSAACAAAWDMHSLIFFRALQGIGAGAIMATVNTLAGDLFAIKERARIQGWLSSVWGLSAIAGPTLGGVFAEYASWRWIFFVNVPLGAVSLFLISVFLHEEVEKRSHRVDYLGGFFILLTIGIFVFLLLQGGQAWPWLSWQAAALLSAFFVLLAISIQVERKAAEPIIPMWLWSNRVLSGSNLAMIGMGIIMMGPIAYLPTFAQSVYGLSTIVAGFVLGVMSIGWPLASSFSGRLYLTIGFRNTALIGASFLAAAAILFLLFAEGAPVAFIVFNQLLIGAGFGLISTPLLVGSQAIVGWSQRGVVTGGNMFSRYLGQTLGAAIFGAIFNAVLGTHLDDAPMALVISTDIDRVIETLHDSSLAPAVGEYLRYAIFDATQHIYMGILLLSVIVFLFICLTPKKFPLVDQ